jgi:transcription elongation factor Elf1
MPHLPHKTPEDFQEATFQCILCTQFYDVAVAIETKEGLICTICDHQHNVKIDTDKN